MLKTNRRGMAITFISRLALAVMLGSIVIAALTGGPLYNTLTDGQTSTEDALNSYSGTIEVTNQKTLADAGMFVYDRAWGCPKVADQLEAAEDSSNSRDVAYPGLSGTVYTANPDCVGETRSNLVQPSSILPTINPGQDMEGKFGKLSFEITQRFTVETGSRIGSKSYAESWEDRKFKVLGVSNGTEFHDKLGEGDAGQYWTPSTRSKGSPGDPYSGKYAFPIFFPESTPRIKDTGADPTAKTLDEMLTEPSICENWYYQGCSSSDTASLQRYWNLGMHPLTDGWQEITFCPGDKGYIQVNKKKPTNRGDVDSEDLYPFIQITELGECE